MVIYTNYNSANLFFQNMYKNTYSIFIHNSLQLETV